MEPTEIDVAAVVIGAGFGGLRALIELRTLGVSARLIEAGSDVGGTWQWNRYPGARTDSEAWTYCYSFSEELLEEWDWEERYPSQPEVLRYLRHVADRFDLRPDIDFDTRVVTAAYRDRDHRWKVTTDTGVTYRCTFLICAVGPLSKPLDPPFAGLESFRGDWHLTARWPAEGVDVAGKRVGVIGTGATGIQVVPVLADAAAEVRVFQRTANFVIPGRNRPLSDSDRRRIKDRYRDIWDLTQRQVSGFAIEETTRTYQAVPPAERRRVLEEAWRDGGFQFLFATFSDLFVDEDVNEAVAGFLRDKIRETVHDPETAERLCPRGYPFGAKRPPLEHGYLEAFNRPNVTLVDISRDPIEGITPDGVRTGSAEHPCDVLIFAMGFDASTGSVLAIDVQGHGGATLSKKWASGPRTFLGITVDGFPNLFLVSGPQTPFGNVPVAIENEVRWIGAAIRHGLGTGQPIDPSPVAVQAWTDEVDRCLSRSFVRHGTLAHSWFLGENLESKPCAPLFYFGRADWYFERLRQVAADGFVDCIAGP
ncbi:MAG TPA: NAD(P)/FAD-dependent oxidoreductase [Acidimicrobiia bacterium]|nr:NAD(P)/FAD-dependent oxidoreductase [Acidimicrobiia bacterium]